MRFTKYLPAYMGLCILACFILMQGCSEDVSLPTKHALKPAPETELQPLRRLPSGESAMKPAGRGRSGWACAIRLIRARKGGKVELDGNSVEIPKGALGRSRFISIAVNRNFVICDFGPDGTVFKKPVKITISYKGADLRGIDEDEISIYWWNPERSCWEKVESKVDKARKTVSAEVWHFSRYALI